MAPEESANLTRFDGRRAGFYEVYFVEVQDAAQQSGLWVRYTLRSPVESADRAVAELWAMYFDRRDASKRCALKRTVPFGEARVGKDRFSFGVGDAEIDHGGCRGEIAEGERKIRWDLRWRPGRSLVHFPYPIMYSAAFPKTKVVSPHFDMRASGSYACGDDAWTLEDTRGQQSHLWGTQHAFRWIWCHSNTFAEDSSAVFEALSAQIKAGPIAVPPLTMFALHYKGEDYLFNRPLELLRKNESRLDAGVAARSYYPVSRWIIGGGNDKLRFRGEIWAPLETFIGVRYTDPDGSPLVCNHSKVASAKLEILLPERGGWRVADTLSSTGGTALEFVGREADPRVPVLI